MLVVERLRLLFGDAEPATDLFTNYLLSNDLITPRLFEIFPGDALLGGFLLEIFERLEFHLLTHLVQRLDEIGIAVDGEIFSFFEEQLLVDQIAEDVFFAIAEDLTGVRWVLLLDFVLELIFAALVLGARNDLVINSRDNLFDNLSASKSGQAHRNGENQGKSLHLHKGLWATTPPLGLAGRGALNRYQIFYSFRGQAGVKVPQLRIPQTVSRWKTRAEQSLNSTDLMEIHRFKRIEAGQGRCDRRRAELLR